MESRFHPHKYVPYIYIMHMSCIFEPYPSPENCDVVASRLRLGDPCHAVANKAIAVANLATIEWGRSQIALGETLAREGAKMPGIGRPKNR